MKGYRRLNLEDRETIRAGIAAGKSIRGIAQELGRSASTVSREISRSALRPRYYRAVGAQRRAQGQAFRRRTRKLDRHFWLLQEVLRRLRRYWSPMQIARGLKRDFPKQPDMQVSHETIYSYVFVLSRGHLRAELKSYLRQPRTRRRSRSDTKRVGGSIVDMLSIEQRPAEVADRIIPGHWEGDLIVGPEHQSALGTLVERSTRHLLLVPLKGKDARSVREAFAKAFKSIPGELRRSLTYDQGSEMAQHRLFTQETQMQVYFCHPHSPWERATNENFNGVVRQFFPKETDFSKISEEEVRRVQDLINERPRKILNWRSPAEAFAELLR